MGCADHACASRTAPAVRVLGFVQTAAAGTLFVVVTLALFDRFGRPRQRRLRLSVLGGDAVGVTDAIRRAFPEARIIAVPKDGPEGRTAAGG
jgi:hypothetical protein